MPIFSEEQRNLYPDHQHEILLIDRLSDEVNKVLLEEKSGDLPKVKSALFDIVVLSKLLRRLGIEVQGKGTVKGIRDSIAHIDERLDAFDLTPTVIHGEPWRHEKPTDETFKLSKTYNFQGAISEASVSPSGDIRALGPYGMIDDKFIWIDKSGRQNSTSIEQIRDEYSEFISTARQEINRLK